MLLTSHQCRAIQNLCTWNLRLKQTVHHSKVWLCKNGFQGLKISPQAWGILSSEKTRATWSTEHLKSDPSKYVAKREKRKDDSILLRHMDDEEHLMRNFERMKTSLLLTDVVVLRNTRDAVNFLGLEIRRAGASK